MSLRGFALGTAIGLCYFFHSARALDSDRIVKEMRFPAQRLALSPDATTIALAFEDKVTLLRIPSGEKLHELPSQEFNVLALQFSPDGKYLAVGSRKGTYGGNESLRLFDVEKGEKLHDLGEWWNFDSVMSVAFTPDSKTLAWFKDRTLLRLDIESGERQRTLLPFTPASLLYSTDGKTLFAGENSKLHRLSAESGRIEKTFGKDRLMNGPRIIGMTGHDGFIRCLAVSPDGRWLATADQSFGRTDHKIILWDLKTDKQELVIKPVHGAFLNYLSFAGSSSGLVVEEGMTATTYEIDWEKKAAYPQSVHSPWAVSLSSVAFASQAGRIAFLQGSDRIVKDSFVVFKAPRELRHVTPDALGIEVKNDVAYWKTDERKYAMPLSPLLYEDGIGVLKSIGYKITRPEEVQNALSVLEQLGDTVTWDATFQRQLKGGNFWVEYPREPDPADMIPVFRYPTVLPEGWQWHHALAKCQRRACLGNRIVGWKNND